MNNKQLSRYPRSVFAIAVTLAMVCGGHLWAAGPAKNGTTLAAAKTIDICDNGDGTWHYSGEVSVWNAGVMATENFEIRDCIQNKAVNAPNAPVDVPELCQTLGLGAVIRPYTSQETATLFPYAVDGQPLDGYIRNSAVVTITNHSGSLGVPKGPNPKATYGTVNDGVFVPNLVCDPADPLNVGLACMLPPACARGDEGDPGCTYTQGYWGSKPGVQWPVYDRADIFYLSGLSWQTLFDAAAEGNGYFILAHQYMAAMLNQANGASVPSGVQDILNLSTTWFMGNTQGTPKIGSGRDAIAATGCYVAGSCGGQKTWAGILDAYNNGSYVSNTGIAGPPHCSNE